MECGMNTNANPKYEKLKSLLKELFQLDQPDLDFGIYRIMHARSEEITRFLDKDLLPQVKASFAAYQPADRAAIKAELDKAVAQAQELGADPETLPKVKELRDQLTGAAVDTDALESEVYDHLYSFFRRYYSEGDFISKRVYKEGVYAIPYEGEEVKLYWANHDQYYIKTSEYLRDYAFRLNPNNEKNPLRVHFRLVDAAEGEHNNVKETVGKNRVSVLTGENFIGVENGELVIKFEYRPATLTDWPEAERTKQSKPPSQKELIMIAEQRIFAVQDPSLLPWITELKQPQIKADGTNADYSRLMAHLNRYTARNTFDYFIHKDLGGFLQRELDFYIKNEVMHLDDIENENAPRVEQYLSKIKVIRGIAKKIIDFLAQIENFQKKLWLKKKFVVETNYCMTLDRVPEEFYPEIAANQAQVQEWVKLGFLEEDSRKDAEGAKKNKDLFGASMDGKLYASDVSVVFLKANNKLVLDTRFFSEDFKAKLIASIDHFDEQMDGLLIHSENFQALNLLQARYREQVKCVYIDPPYNTGNDGFNYRDNYQHSSWLAMMHDRLAIGKELSSGDSVLFASIGDEEIASLKIITNDIYGYKKENNVIHWKKNQKPQNASKSISESAEYILVSYKNKPFKLVRPMFGTREDEEGSYKPSPMFKFDGRERRVQIIPIGTPVEAVAWLKGRIFGARNKLAYIDVLDDPIVIDGKLANNVRVSGEWCVTETNGAFQKIITEGRLFINKNGFPNEKAYRDDDSRNVHTNLWLNTGFNEQGKQTVDMLFGIPGLASYPKPVELIREICSAINDGNATVLDYFAGSGTTAHAVINLNREDGGKRKYILVEMGDYFDTVLKPRIQKVIYSADWKDGKPTSRNTGVSHCFKYIRLESYEDTLNNLELRRTEQQADLFSSQGEGAKSFKEDYLLHYMLDVESRGSASLLNTEAFMDPTAYKLKVKIPGSDESRVVPVDLMETFNYLLGLQVEHIAAPQCLSADFERDSEQRLRIKGRLTELSSASSRETTSAWWFRTVTGTTLDGRKILVIWRNRPGGESPEGVEQDNLVLDEWFKKMGYSSKDREFDLIYVNGTNNLENLKTPDDQWKVRLIEEDFKRLMFEETGV